MKVGAVGSPTAASYAVNMKKGFPTSARVLKIASSLTFHEVFCEFLVVRWDYTILCTTFHQSTEVSVDSGIGFEIKIE